MTRWEKDRDDFGWVMPSAARWKRLPIIRHIRALYHVGRVRDYDGFYRSLGMIPTGYDDWVLHGIWMGFEND